VHAYKDWFSMKNSRAGSVTPDPLWEDDAADLLWDATADGLARAGRGVP